jgi:hypothetical protein
LGYRSVFAMCSLTMYVQECVWRVTMRVCGLVALSTHHRLLPPPTGVGNKAPPDQASPSPAAGQAWSGIAAQLVAGVQPGLLLFLRRVRRLLLHDAASGLVHVLTRRDRPVDATSAAATDQASSSQGTGATPPASFLSHPTVVEVCASRFMCCFLRFVVSMIMAARLLHHLLNLRWSSFMQTRSQAQRCAVSS